MLRVESSSNFLFKFLEMLRFRCTLRVPLKSITPYEFVDLLLTITIAMLTGYDFNDIKYTKIYPIVMCFI